MERILQFANEPVYHLTNGQITSSKILFISIFCFINSSLVILGLAMRGMNTLSIRVLSTRNLEASS